MSKRTKAAWRSHSHHVTLLSQNPLIQWTLRGFLSGIGRLLQKNGHSSLFQIIIKGFFSTKWVLKVWPRITLGLFILLFVFAFSYIVRWMKWKGELSWQNIVKYTETDPATIFQSTVCVEIRQYGISEIPNTDQGKTNCGVLDNSRCSFLNKSLLSLWHKDCEFEVFLGYRMGTGPAWET